MSTLILLLLSLAAQGGSPPGLDCQKKILVYYTAGPHLNQAGQFFQQHLQYVVGQMKAGAVAMGGPTDDQGGLIVYNSTDPAEVEKLVKEDPFIKAGVFTWRQAGWHQCVAAPAH